MLLAGLVLLLGGGPGMAAESRCREISTTERVGLENGRVEIGFDARSGALVSLKNLATGDEYLKAPGAAGNVFRLGLDPVVEYAPGDLAAASGTLVEAGQCQLVEATFRRTDGAGILTLQVVHPAERLGATLRATLPDGDCAVDLELTVANRGDGPRALLVSFPYLDGLGLGERRETNLAVRVINADAGRAGFPAWQDDGPGYAAYFANPEKMDWQAVYEPSQNEGLGLIVMDPSTRNKTIRRHAQGLAVTYCDPETLSAAQQHSYPPARLVVHRGNWRVAARRYREWFEQAFQVRQPPAWLNEVDLFGWGWIPNPGEAIKLEGRADTWRDFRQLPWLFLGDPYPYDIKEWARYESRCDDGIYSPRHDLGGAAALREGITALHRMGRRVTFYKSGFKANKDSDLTLGGVAESWRSIPEPSGIPTQWKFCLGCPQWQDHLAESCRRLLWETGGDGIRLDNLGYEGYEPCFNPEHHHTTPYGWHQWYRELLRKVRAAMDEVNPQALLLTESPMSYYAESCNGALCQVSPGADVAPMRVALPTAYRIWYYGERCKASAAEAALSGLGAQSPYLYLKQDWAWVPGPYENWTDTGPVTRWPELHASLRAAMVEGYPTDEDPVALTDPTWRGRLWTSEKYWCLVGGHLDGTPLAGPTRIRLPELPADVKQAWEFDFMTLERQPAPLERTAEGIFLTVHNVFSAVLLPLADCLPLVDMRDVRLQPGETRTVRLEAFAPWRRDLGEARAQVQVAALEPSAPVEVTLPATVEVSAPQTTLPGAYLLTVSGDCLPLKRSVQVR